MDHTFRARSLRADHRRRAGVSGRFRDHRCRSRRGDGFGHSVGTAGERRHRIGGTGQLRHERRRDADDGPVRHVRLQGERPLRPVPASVPERHDPRGRRRAVGRLLDAAEDPPRVGQRARRRPGDRDRLRRRRRRKPRRPVRELRPTGPNAGAARPSSTTGSGRRRARRTARRPSASAPTSARRRSATARTCSTRPASSPTPPSSPRRGRRGTTSSPSARTTRTRRPSPPTRTSSTPRRASSRPAVYQGEYAYTTPDGTARRRRTAPACRRHGGTPPRRRRTASPPACSSSPTRLEQGVLEWRVRGDRLPDAG